MRNQIQVDINPELRSPIINLAIGYLLVEFSFIEQSIALVVRTFHTFMNPNGALPPRFDDQAVLLAGYVRDLYGDGPDYTEFRRLLSEVKAIKRKRDSVAHGMPAICTFRGRRFEGLAVVNWTNVKKPNALPASEQVLKVTAERASLLKQEWFWVEKQLLLKLHIDHQFKHVPPELRGKASGIRMRSLMVNPFRNPTPAKPPAHIASPLPWPADTSAWTTTLPYSPHEETRTFFVAAYSPDEIVVRCSGTQSDDA